MAVTLFGRNIFRQNNVDIIYRADWLVGDITIIMLHVLQGHIYQLPMKGAAYRYWHNLECYMKKNYRLNFSFEKKDDIMIEAMENIPLPAIWRVARTLGCPLKCLKIAIGQRLADSNLILGYQENGSKNTELCDFIDFRRVAKQGKSYKGVIVRNPNTIMLYKDIQPVVLIANQKHEREIALQLENMNINDYYYYCAMQKVE